MIKVKKLKVFLDTSVLFSSIYSQSGGSRRICQLIKERKVRGFTSETVIEELEANMIKFAQKNTIAPKNFIANHKLIVMARLTEKESRSYQKITVLKDAHVLAGAALCRCDYLLTLDKRHVNNAEVKKNYTRVIIASPKEFLEYFSTMNRI